MTNSQREALAPCPFCGGDNVEVSRSGEFWESGCDDCAIRGLGHDSKIEAIAAWNRRATPAGQDAPDAIEAAFRAGFWAFSDGCTENNAWDDYQREVKR